MFIQPLCQVAPQGRKQYPAAAGHAATHNYCLRLEDVSYGGKSSGQAVSDIIHDFQGKFISLGRRPSNDFRSDLMQIIVNHTGNNGFFSAAQGIDGEFDYFPVADVCFQSAPSFRCLSTIHSDGDMPDLAGH